MNLPNATATYDQANEQQARRVLTQEDNKNFKQGKDILLVRERIVLLSPDGTEWALAVSNAGVVSATAYP